MNKGKMVEQDVKMEEMGREKSIFMCGYLPGALPQRSPILSPVIVRSAAHAWKDVCGGGCGFAMAISVLFQPESGKLITWGSTDDLGQSYLTSGKHGVVLHYITLQLRFSEKYFALLAFKRKKREKKKKKKRKRNLNVHFLFLMKEIPEPFPLPTEASIAKAAAGWAHCVAVTDNGEVYTWGWKECVPSGKVFGDLSAASLEKDVFERQNQFLTEQASPLSQGSRSIGGSGTLSGIDSKGGGDENTKRRRISSAKQAAESSSSGDETLSALPCLVTLNPGVRIVTVAAGGRHTLALSDMGQVWGWGYGGEGQLGLGTRMRMVSSPHPIPCIDSTYKKDKPTTPRGGMSSEGQSFRVPGSYVKGIACGGRHSAVITDAGALLTFGWGLYGQCGQGSTDDELSPTCVSSLLGIQIDSIAAGLWHTVCISADGGVYAFGGNQFGQLGTGSDQAEIIPRLLDAPSLENVNARVVSCGARHSAMVSEDGNAFCWGWNKYGQLGLGDVIDRNIPTQVTIEGCVPINVACGWWHTLLLAKSSA